MKSGQAPRPVPPHRSFPLHAAARGPSIRLFSGPVSTRRRTRRLNGQVRSMPCILIPRATSTKIPYRREITPATGPLIPTQTTGLLSILTLLRANPRPVMPPRWTASVRQVLQKILMRSNTFGQPLTGWPKYRTPAPHIRPTALPTFSITVPPISPMSEGDIYSHGLI